GSTKRWNGCRSVPGQAPSPKRQRKRSGPGEVLPTGSSTTNAPACAGVGRTTKPAVGGPGGGAGATVTVIRRIAGVVDPPAVACTQTGMFPAASGVQRTAPVRSSTVKPEGSVLQVENRGGPAVLTAVTAPSAL